MHNGGIADFHLMKRRLQKELPDVAFDMVQGNTGMSLECIRLSTRTPWHSLDSEWAFALFLSKVSYLFLGILRSHSDRGGQLPDCNARSFTSETLRKAMAETIATLNDYAEEFNVIEVRIL